VASTIVTVAPADSAPSATQPTSVAVFPVLRGLPLTIKIFLLIKNLFHIGYVIKISYCIKNITLKSGICNLYAKIDIKFAMREMV
jgi:hypothetical protein